MAGETGGIGTTNMIPQQPAAVADATYVKPPVVVPPPQTPTPVTAPPPQDQSQVAQTGTANTQVSLVEQPQESAAPPLQPAVEEPDLPSPPSYSFHNAQVIDAFKAKHGRRVLSAGIGEQMAAAVLGQLGIDPGDQSAVVRLQRKIGAYPDGKFGPETWGKAIAYLTDRHDRGDANAQQALTILLTPTASGKGGGGQVYQPPVQADPNGQVVDPNAYAPQQQQQPQELTETQVRQALDEPANTAMIKALDDAGWSKRDDVAEAQLNNPAALFVMQPKTVARHITELINGWTTDSETEAMMKGLRTTAATGQLGETLKNLDIGDLKSELSSSQVTELKGLAADPNSGVDAETLKKINS